MFTKPEGEEDKHAYHTPIEDKLQDAVTPFQEYINKQIIASFFLFFCTITALVWASMPTLATYYDAFIDAPFGFFLSNFSFSTSLHFLVNDVLLTFFFFFVGLEIKREFLVGELTNYRSAAFVVMAALGGMIVPSTLYFIINYDTPTQLGWGIPMATDTAFALGILNCFKQKIPKGIFTFLAALAIIDDIGAILVIALFYTNNFDANMFLLAMFFCTLLAALNYAGFRRPFAYLAIGALVWASVEASGIHGTVAGILVAFLIPARPRKGPRHFIKKTRALLNLFEKRKDETPLILEDHEQHLVLEKVQEVARQATTPLQRWESKLELPVALLVLPLFALVNAGLAIRLDLIKEIFLQPISIGILIGLFFGKPLGIFLFSRLALWLKLGNMPANTSHQQILSVSLLTGIGFTMSIFVSNLSFGGQEHLIILSKAAVLVSSLVAGLAGIIALTLITRKERNHPGIASQPADGA